MLTTKKLGRVREASACEGVLCWGVLLQGFGLKTQHNLQRGVHAQIQEGPASKATITVQCHFKQAAAQKRH